MQQNIHFACSTVTFLPTALKPQHRSRTQVHARKANETWIPTIYCHTEILSTFHTRGEYISVTKYAIETTGPIGQTTPKSTPSPDTRWLPSNKWISGVTPLTTPNDSSIGSRTSAPRNNVPIGYNGTPQIHPPNYPSPSTIITHLIHPYPSLDRPHSPSQTASGSNQPCCHCSHVRTYIWDKRKLYPMSAPLIERCAISWSSLATCQQYPKPAV